MVTDFKKRVLSAIAWRMSVDISQQVLQIAFTAILARLLTRADFGLVAMALLVTRFVQAMTQVGFGSAIIQSQEATDAQISAIFFIQIAINFFASLACYAAAPLAAAFFNEPKLIPVSRVLACVLLINSFAFPQILLQKRLQVGGYSLLEMGSMIASNIVGIVMAFKGFGVWALIFRLLIGKVLFTIGIWPVAAWFPVRPRFAGVGKLFRFGLYMLGSHMFYYFSQNLPAIITGRFIGVETLGSFNIAYNLAIVPAQKIQSVLTTVLTPAFSKIQGNVAEFRKKFFASVFSIGLIFIPLMLGLAAVAQNLVVFVYGEKWREAGLFLTFIAVVGMFKGMQHLLRSVIIAKGRPSIIFGIIVAETGASLPLLLVGFYFFDVIGLIVAYMAASFFSFVLTVRAAQRSVEDNTIFLRATMRSSTAAGVMFVIVLGYSVLIPSQVLLTLCTQIVLGTVMYAGLRIKFLTDEERVLVSSWPLIHLVLSKK